MKRPRGSGASPRSSDEETEMTTQQLNLLAVVSIAVCWCAVVVTWAVAENHNEGRAPAERTRSWFGTAVVPGVIMVTAISFAVPKADWRSLTLYIPSARILGLVILLAATAFTSWARLVLGVDVERRAHRQGGARARTSGPYGITRHPIYTGLLGMLLGSMLVAGGGRLIVAFPVYLMLVEIKIRVEERLMLAEFPDGYPRYRQQVPQLVPGLHLIGASGGQQVGAPPAPGDAKDATMTQGGTSVGYSGSGRIFLPVSCWPPRPRVTSAATHLPRPRPASKAQRGSCDLYVRDFGFGDHGICGVCNYLREG